MKTKQCQAWAGCIFSTAKHRCKNRIANPTLVKIGGKNLVLCYMHQPERDWNALVTLLRLEELRK